MGKASGVAVEQFVKDYERALATQDWAVVEPLVHHDACVTFSNGTVHVGKQAVKAAYLRNFSLIKNETYTVFNLRWILKSEQIAVYLFDFSWKGLIDGNPAEGSGRGTTVISRQTGVWQLLAEHLGPRTG